MVCLMGTLAFGSTTAAADVPPPPPPARALSGTVLFKEDFTDTTLSRWRADRSGVWSVSNGMLRGVLPDLRQQHSVIEAGSDDWTDVALDVDLCQMRGVDKGAVVRVSRGSGIGVDLRGPGYDDVLLRHREWPLGRATVPLANGVWHHLRLEARGHRYSVWVDGAHMLTRKDMMHLHATGHIALATYTGGIGECEVWFAHVRVTMLGEDSANAGDDAATGRSGAAP